MKKQIIIQKIMMISMMILFITPQITIQQKAKQIPFYGTSYMSDLFTAWSDQYNYQNPSYQFVYNDVGSDDALQMLLNNSSPFVAIDYPLNDTFYQQYPDVQLIPITGGVVVPYFTLLTVGLTFDLDTLAQIFLGNITMWNDTRIQSTNPSVVLSSKQINVVYRMDDAISTYALSLLLSNISTEWREKYGVTYSFPNELRKKSNFFGALGEQGATTLTRRFNSGLTYLTGNGMFATNNLIQYARLLNQNGTRTDLRSQFTEPVLIESEQLFDSHFTADLVNINLPLAYPIITYTYIAVKKTTTTSELCSDLKIAIEFLLYSLNTTITITSADIKGYIHLPPNIVELVKEMLFSIRCNNEQLVSSIKNEAAPYILYQYNYSIPTFEGLTIVTYVPFYNYLGSTISASAASTFDLTTLTSLYSSFLNANDRLNYLLNQDKDDNINLGRNNASASSSLRPSISFICITLIMLTLISSSSSPSSSPSSSSSSSSSSAYRLKKKNQFNRFSFLSISLMIITMLMMINESKCDTRTITLGYVFPLTGNNTDTGVQMEAAARLAIVNANVNQSSTIFQSVSYDSGMTLITGDFAVTTAINKNFVNLMIGGLQDRVTEAMVALSQTFIIPFVGAGARGNSLTPVNSTISSNNSSQSSGSSLAWSSLSSSVPYPLFSRVVPPYRADAVAIASIIEFYGWSDLVATISSSDDYGVAASDAFTAKLASFGYVPKGEARYFSGSTDFSDQMNTLRSSLARVIVIFTSSVNDTAMILEYADHYHLIGDQFVWFAGSPSCTSELFTNPETGEINEYIRSLAIGMIGVKLKGGYGPLYESFLDQWDSLNPSYYSGAGKPQIAAEATYAYDAVLLVTYALNQEITTLDGLLYNIRNANLTGLTGDLNLKGSQDRSAIFNIVNLQMSYDGDQGWVVVGDYFEVNNEDPISLGCDFTKKIMFHSREYSIPDLIMHNSLTYWSCEDKEKKTDKSGKKVRLDAPGPNAKQIDIKYKCDEFIDCYNLSDEDGCSPSYIAAYIAIGIILGLSILFALFCIFFTIIFGYIFRRMRIRTASPLFLILICISCIAGFGSDYAYFGQDSKVSCPFRMWLVTLGLITMISSLFIKSFRVWRLYRAKSKILPLPDWKLLIMVAFMIFPVILIDFLWTLIATPTASLISIGGDKHYVCHAGGFVGDPYGYVFFAIVCAYIGIILLFGVFLSIVTRNIISTFNESRLIAVSTYNLFFLGIIGIPVYLVIYQSNPLASWVIYEVCVLYGFLSTLAMQFIPKIYGIIFVDKFKNTSTAASVNDTTTQTNTSEMTNPNALF